jgi:hypothetical protein
VPGSKFRTFYDVELIAGRQFKVELNKADCSFLENLLPKIGTKLWENV